MSKFDDFLGSVGEGVGGSAREILGGHEAEARDDATAFLEATRSDLERWAQLLAGGELARQEFEDLVAGRKALAEIHALRQAGVAQAKLDRFKDRLIELVVDAAVRTFVP